MRNGGRGVGAQGSEGEREAEVLGRVGAQARRRWGHTKTRESELTGRTYGTLSRLTGRCVL